MRCRRSKEHNNKPHLPHRPLARLCALQRAIPIFGVSLGQQHPPTRRQRSNRGPLEGRPSRSIASKADALACSSRGGDRPSPSSPTDGRRSPCVPRRARGSRCSSIAAVPTMRDVRFWMPRAARKNTSSRLVALTSSTSLSLELSSSSLETTRSPLSSSPEAPSSSE